MARGHICMALLAAALIVPVPLEAQWAPGGVPVCGPCSASDRPLLAGDDAGGVFALWRQSAGGQTDVYLQRITADGEVSPGWPDTGIALSTNPRNDAPQGLLLDGAGGVWALWQESNTVTGTDLWMQRVRGDGSLVPGWPASGVPVVRAPRNQVQAAIVADGAGGAYVAWEDGRYELTLSRDVYAQHLLADGAVAPGWMEDGLPVCTIEAFAGSPVLLANGVEGTLVGWIDNRRGVVDIFAQRLLADGSIAPGWESDGRLLVPEQHQPKVALDGAGGFYLATATPHSLTNGDKDFFLHRFAFDGTPAPGWPAGGVTVCEGADDPNLFDDRYDLQVEPDGFGGLFLSWYDYRSGSSDIYAARFRSDGTRAQGWAENGVQVSGTGGFVGGHFDARLAADVAGGVYVAWEWQTSNSSALVQHLSPDGTVAPGWIPGGTEVHPGVAGQFKPEVASDGSGGAIVVWREGQTGGRGGLWAQRFGMDGPVPVQIALASAEATPEQVTLIWHGDMAGISGAAVERRSESSAWARIGAPEMDGADRLQFVDLDVRPGDRYAYRLTWTEGGQDRSTWESWVDVPMAFSFGLEGFRPNPSRGRELSIAFTLPAAGPATLEVLDIAGRRLANSTLSP